MSGHATRNGGSTYNCGDHVHPPERRAPSRARFMSARCADAFQANRDRRFLWLGARYRDAFDSLRDAIVRGRSLVILTGEVGSGKTMLADAVTARLVASGMRIMVGWIAHPSRDGDDFWTAMVSAFGLRPETDTRDAVCTRFAELLHQVDRLSTRVLLVVDEAQALPSEVLTEIAHALDAAGDVGASSALTVVLVGEEELDGTLAARSHAGLARRVELRLRLPRLGEDEVRSYLRHRLACVQAPDDVFTPAAVAAIARLSCGIPRLINALCARATARGGVVDATAVERCGREMFWLSHPGRHRAGARVQPRNSVVTARRSRRRRLMLAMLAAAAVLALTSATSDDAPPWLTRRSAPPADAPPPAELTSPAPDPALVTSTSDGTQRTLSPLTGGRGSADTDPPPALRRAPRARTGVPPRPSGSPAARATTPPAAAAPAPDDAPDPGAIIDWLLRERGQHAATTR